METISIICPGCSAEIHLDETRDFEFCTYCGTKVTRSNSENDSTDKTEQSDSAEAESNGVHENVGNNNAQSVLKNPLAIAVIVVLLIAVAGISLISKVIIPNSEYKTAAELISSGSYDEAISVLNRLGDYKDSAALKKNAEIKKEELRINSVINDAKQLYHSGNRMEAYKLLLPEKENETVSAMLLELKQEIIDLADDNIEWDNNRDANFRYGYLDDMDLFSPGGDPSVNFCLVVNKKDSSVKRIYIEFAVIQTLAGNNLPNHPTKIIFENQTGRIEIPVRYNDTSVETDYALGGWWEIGGAPITLEQTDKIAEMFSDNQKVNMKLVGVSRQREYILDEDEATALKEMAEFINLVYTLE